MSNMEGIGRITATPRRKLERGLRLEPFPAGIEEECDEQDGKYEEQQIGQRVDVSDKEDGKESGGGQCLPGKQTYRPS